MRSTERVIVYVMLQNVCTSVRVGYHIDTIQLLSLLQYVTISVYRLRFARIPCILDTWRKTPILYTNEVLFMQTDRQQLAMNLSYLIKNEDVIPGELCNEILLEYVELIDNKRLDDLLEYTNNEVTSDFGRG